MLDYFKNHVKNKLPFLKEGRLVIAISGGIDSVVLAHLCQMLDFNFALAHCNFNLRAEESNADEDFVMALGEVLNVEVFVQNFDTETYADSNKLSIQMAARELRYNWFEELATQLNFDFILTAHHADDNLETFLINFTRGTGLNGLTGIPEMNDNIVRPLLQFSRVEIEAFAIEHQIKWREDSSNSSRKYLRNKLRHEVVPVLKEINPQLLDSFKNTLNYLNDTADIVDESLNAVAKRAIVDISENGITYKVSEFQKVNNPKAYLFEMFKDFGFTEWKDVVNLLEAETGKYVKSSSHRLIKHREFLVLTELDRLYLNQESYFIEQGRQTIETSFGTLHFENVDTHSNNSKEMIFIDSETIKYPLELRLWETGDMFHPIGMKGKKKVSKYLKDEKLSPVDKENTWVLVSDNEIVWIVGRRADHRYRITDKTQQILKITITS